MLRKEDSQHFMTTALKSFSEYYEVHVQETTNPYYRNSESYILTTQYLVAIKKYTVYKYIYWFFWLTLPKNYTSSYFKICIEIYMTNKNCTKIKTILIDNLIFLSFNIWHQYHIFQLSTQVYLKLDFMKTVHIRS